MRRKGDAWFMTWSWKEASSSGFHGFALYTSYIYGWIRKNMPICIFALEFYSSQKKIGHSYIQPYIEHLKRDQNRRVRSTRDDI